jgi:hypothetical protein
MQAENAVEDRDVLILRVVHGRRDLPALFWRRNRERGVGSDSW